MATPIRPCSRSPKWLSLSLWTRRSCSAPRRCSCLRSPWGPGTERQRRSLGGVQRREHSAHVAGREQPAAHLLAGEEASHRGEDLQLAVVLARRREQEEDEPDW